MKLFILVLFCFCGLTTFSVEGVGSEVMKRSFCVSLTSKPLPVNSVKSYLIEEGPMRAVIFVTRRGIKICADPEVNWAKGIIRTVDSKLKKRNTMQTKPTGSQPPTDRATTMSGKPASI
ncbi:cytokine SCM-1 beta-like isoform X2 [Dromiciops gliroides]|uniref:cytokine SCM-1 beta-like isoform X2 n=1 Tax=Dromiciops gliroides TaxID=33562 RepID=UPI001CC68FA5|nr:cytokine SCM-1 beta-like isoform X2 [Dromiciops gliroides]